MAFLSQGLEQSQWLLVIDNVDDPKPDLTPFLPRWRNGAVIITSRNHSRGQLSPPGHLQLDVMTLDESVELLSRGCGLQWPLVAASRPVVVAMAEELGYHPIALVQAISYMYNTGCSAASYIALLREHRHRLLRDYPATNQMDMRYKTAYAAFDAAYNILPPKAQKFWHLLSFFQWQKFPVELVTMAAPNGFSTDQYPYLARGEEFERAKGCLKEIFFTSDQWDPLEFQSILVTLRSHSLITIVPVNKMTLLQMHPLVHEWGRLCMPEEDVHQFQNAAIRLLCCGATEDNDGMMQYLSPHVEGLSSVWEGLHANDASPMAFILHMSGMHKKATMLDEIAHRKTKSELGPMNPNTVKAAQHLAVGYCALGHYAKGEGLHKEVVQQQIQLLGSEHPETIRASANLASAYYDLGHYAKAAELEEQVLQQRKQLLGAEHPDTIWASAQLATTFYTLGKLAEAEALDTEVLGMRTTILGEQHPDTIHAMFSLAQTYKVTQHHSEASSLARRALGLALDAVGDEHPLYQKISTFVATLPDEESL